MRQILIYAHENACIFFGIVLAYFHGIPHILYGGDYMYLIIGMLIAIVTAKYGLCLYYGLKPHSDRK